MWHRDPHTLLIAPGHTAFWHTLWSSPAFRQLLADERIGYGAVRDWAAQQPWWFYTPHEAYEHRHFSVWFAQAIGRRVYANPVLADLYLFHDMLHARTFVDDPSSTEEAWHLRMRANEIAVSLETEVLVYTRAPALRAHTFDHPIWADTLLAGPLSALDADRLAAYRAGAGQTPYEQALRAAVPTTWPLVAPALPFGSYEDLWDLRRALTLAPQPGVRIEQAFAHYERLAESDYAGWAQDWRSVEADRLAFQAQVDAGDWQGACLAREAQWTAHADGRGVPYGWAVADPPQAA